MQCSPAVEQQQGRHAVLLGAYAAVRCSCTIDSLVGTDEGPVTGPSALDDVRCGVAG